MQNGGRGKVVQLEAVELQEPAKKRVDGKPDTPLQMRDEAYTLLWRWVWRSLHLLPFVISVHSGSDRDHERRWEKPLGL